jgi:hypothetical protein
MLDDFDDDTFRIRLDEDRDDEEYDDDRDNDNDDWDDWDDRDDDRDDDDRDDDRDDHGYGYDLDSDDGDDDLSDDRHDDDNHDDRDHDDGCDDDDRDGDDDDARFEDVVTVAYLYEATLNRDGEINLVGFNFWAARLDAGATTYDIAEQFLFSDEFARKFGDPDDLDDRALVETCFRNILDRDGAEAGVAHWTGALADPGFDRVDLVLAFTRSAENTGDPGYETRLTEAEDGSWVFG